MGESGSSDLEANFRGRESPTGRVTLAPTKELTGTSWRICSKGGDRVRFGSDPWIRWRNRCREGGYGSESDQDRVGGLREGFAT